VARPAGDGLVTISRGNRPVQGDHLPHWQGRVRPARARDSDCSLAWVLPAGYNGHKWMLERVPDKACSSALPPSVSKAKGAIAWPTAEGGSRCEAL
jgi:hypothetical protein